MHELDQSELVGIDKTSRRALGLATFILIRRLGSPERLMLRDDIAPQAANIMSRIHTQPLTDRALPAFDAQATEGKYTITGRFLGAYGRRFPVAADVTYDLQDPQFTPSRDNLLPKALVTEATLTCWPDYQNKTELPDLEELEAGFTARLVAAALRRLQKSGLPDTALWQAMHL